MAALASLGALALLLLSGLSCCSAEACVEPQITPSYYTTSDAVISTETVFIVEISLTCKNRVQNMALYADVSGKQFPVTRGQDVGRYQVSWSLDHKSAHAGTYEVRFFDEESYSLLRKVSVTRSVARPAEGTAPRLPQPCPPCRPLFLRLWPRETLLMGSRMARWAPSCPPNHPTGPCAFRVPLSCFLCSGQCSCLSYPSPPHPIPPGRAP
uniref:Translocon-associated protein subunit delta n=1 Tax=Equus asinus TaxID=9793 RepID=A0A9L0JXZ6_EQUAS